MIFRLCLIFFCLGLSGVIHVKAHTVLKLQVGGCQTRGRFRAHLRRINDLQKYPLQGIRHYPDDPPGNHWSIKFSGAGGLANPPYWWRCSMTVSEPYGVVLVQEKEVFWYLYILSNPTVESSLRLHFLALPDRERDCQVREVRQHLCRCLQHR